MKAVRKLVQETDLMKKAFQDKEIELKHVIEGKNVLLQSQREELQCVHKQLEQICESIKTERETYTKCIQELELKNEEIPLLQKSLQELQKEFSKKVLDHEKELKCISDAAELNLEILNSTVSSRITDLQVDTEVKLTKTFNGFEKDFKKLENDIVSGLNNVKEVENVLKEKTNEFVINLKEADDRCKFLFKELSKVEGERDDLAISDLEKKLTIIEIQDKCDEFEYNSKIAKEKCKKYEVSVSKMQETIEALSERLYSSESEVERLNKVESDLQSQKFALEEKVRTLIQNGLDLRKSMENMEKEIVQDVNTLKTELVERLDMIRRDAQNEISYLKEAINLRDQDIVNKAQCILDFTIKIDSLEDSKRRADHYTGLIEIEKQDLEVQLFDMTETNLKLENKSKEKDNMIKDLMKKIDVNCSVMNRQNGEIEYLENKINQFKADSVKMNNLAVQVEQCGRNVQYLEHQILEKDKAFKELEHKYEEKISTPEPMLKSLQERIAHLEEENVELTESRNLARQEVLELDQQLGQLMGHQNVRQKIKHVEQLKQQITFMKEEIARLAAELSREKKKNKENGQSPNPVKKVSKQLKPSMSPSNAGPSVLKDRNQ